MHHLLLGVHVTPFQAYGQNLVRPSCAAATLVHPNQMDDSEALALAALWGSIHNLRVLVINGLASPRDVDAFSEAVFEALREGSSGSSSVWEEQLLPLFSDLKIAAERISTSE